MKIQPSISQWIRGVWESLVKSVKRALIVITRDRAFTEDLLTTMRSRICY